MRVENPSVRESARFGLLRQTYDAVDVNIGFDGDAEIHRGPSIDLATFETNLRWEWANLRTEAQPRLAVPLCSDAEIHEMWPSSMSSFGGRFNFTRETEIGEKAYRETDKPCV